MPDFLQLLAQPELGLVHRGTGAGPMGLRRSGAAVLLAPLVPEKLGLPAVPDWNQRTRRLVVSPGTASGAVAAFARGDADAVIGGTFASWPAIAAAKLSARAVQIDPVTGLFGLQVLHQDGFLAQPENREAIAMAIDRDALAGALRIAGWTPTTRMVTPGTGDDPAPVAERWAAAPIRQRQAVAAARVTRWRARKGAVSLRIALPQGAGADILFARLETDLGAAGFKLVRVALNAPADLRLVDVVARYDRAGWFFNQLSCRIHPQACRKAADDLAAQAETLSDPAARARSLAAAETELAAANVFVPFGPPVRWFLAAPDLTGLSTNRWAVHPLLPLALQPPR
jgi:peptide/nickel transport system substrate-binding protein/oligopeptide transport system substrate-binding protein